MAWELYFTIGTTQTVLDLDFTKYAYRIRSNYPSHINLMNRGNSSGQLVTGLPINTDVPLFEGQKGVYYSSAPLVQGSNSLVVNMGTADLERVLLSGNPTIWEHYMAVTNLATNVEFDFARFKYRFNIRNTGSSSLIGSNYTATSAYQDFTSYEGITKDKVLASIRSGWESRHIFFERALLNYTSNPWVLHETLANLVANPKSVDFDFTKYDYKVKVDLKDFVYSLNLNLHNTATTYPYVTIHQLEDTFERALFEGLKGINGDLLFKNGINYLSRDNGANNILIMKRAKSSPPDLKMNINGAIKEFDKGWVNVNGELKEIDKMWARIDDTLKEI